MIADALAQFEKPKAMGIVGVAIVERLAGGRLNTGGRVEIRFADLEVNNINPRTLHFVGPFQDIHDDERSHFSSSFRAHIYIS